MQEFIGILGILLAANFLPTATAVLLSLDEGWHKFWKFFRISWLTQLAIVLILGGVFGILYMIVWGFDLG